MSRIAYVNGRYMPHARAAVSIDDRGYQFGDGIYEVIAIKNGILADTGWHLDRLEYSLGEMDMALPMSRAALEIIIRRVAALNHVREGIVYVQMTRGVMRRDHAWREGLRAQTVITAKTMSMPLTDEEAAAPPTPVKTITTPDIRWQRRDIKTIQLLPNCMAKTRAVRAGAREALLVDAAGHITEGASSNMWIVTHDGELVTHPPGHDILGGITRKAVLELAAARNIKITERAFTPAEAASAAEAFITAATVFITPVGMIDDATIGDGDAGPVTLALRRAYFEHIAQKGEVL